MTERRFIFRSAVVFNLRALFFGEKEQEVFERTFYVFLTSPARECIFEGYFCCLNPFYSKSFLSVFYTYFCIYYIFLYLRYLAPKLFILRLHGEFYATLFSLNCCFSFASFVEIFVK